MVKQERAARTRETLIRSAAEVFDREGYAAASLTGISSLAGVSNGALHFHFASKAALTDAVERAALRRLTEVAEVPVPSAGRVQSLIDVTHGLAAALRGDVVLRAGFGLCGEASRMPAADLRGWWQGWVEGTLKEAEAAGELHPGAAARDVVSAVVAATVGFEVLGTRDVEWLSAATLTRFWRLLLPSLVSSALLAELAPEGGAAAS
ncbi:ScbR family autoregulator-binding transcription factor [Streptomyces sp. NPDC012888]|uniref:ScbR family autoregulator-binding transcription factor n=1 Tax=Streptomyces sp. NPDC012888 TaxID=3364855 RepID=UPI0036AAADD5